MDLEELYAERSELLTQIQKLNIQAYHPFADEEKLQAVYQLQCELYSVERAITSMEEMNTVICV